MEYILIPIGLGFIGGALTSFTGNNAASFSIVVGLLFFVLGVINLLEKR